MAACPQKQDKGFPVPPEGRLYSLQHPRMNAPSGCRGHGRQEGEERKPSRPLFLQGQESRGPCLTLSWL